MGTQASGYTTPRAHTVRLGESGGSVVQSNLIIGRERSGAISETGRNQGSDPSGR